MRVPSIFLILFLIAVESFGQIKYEKGYLITNDNQRIECLIKNRDWNFNPSHFNYKLENSDAPLVGDLTSVKEFGIYNCFKFINADVKIDRSSIQAIGLVDDEYPLWSREKLFLKVLLEGKAKLYCYDSSYGKKFFYSITDSIINQLIYKRFKSGARMGENNTFRNQLLADLSCHNLKKSLVENVNYTTEDLEKYFISYSSCIGDTSVELKNETTRSSFNLKITPGINSSSMPLSLTDVSNKTYNYSFKRNQSFRLGLEAELILPFNMNKWGIVFEPTFQSFNSETKPMFSITTFKSIEFPIGLRYYLYLNDDTRFYVNGFYISSLAINFNSRMEFYPNLNYDMKSGQNAAFGGGVEHKRFSFETRYYTSRNMLKGYGPAYADYSRFSIILGYKIISTKHN